MFLKQRKSESLQVFGLISVGPQSNEVKAYVHSWDEKVTIAKKLLTLLNSYTPPEIRVVCIGMLYSWNGTVVSLSLHITVLFKIAR